MNLKFSIVAEREIEAAADYYETQEAGLGLRFVEELNHATAFILQFPNAWSPIVSAYLIGGFTLWGVDQGRNMIVTEPTPTSPPEPESKEENQKESQTDGAPTS